MAKRNNTVEAIEYQAAANVIRLPATIGVGRVQDSECQILAFPTRTAPAPLNSGSLDIIPKSDRSVWLDGCTSLGLMYDLLEKAMTHRAALNFTMLHGDSGRALFELEVGKPAVADIVAMAIAAGVQVTHAA
jgi:hypothetical protein